MEKNVAQEQVISTIYGQMGVIAVPGAGKTSTSLRRIKNMLDNGIKGENIVMVTFTDAAASEMRAKFYRMFGQNDVTFSTIHSLCLRILNEYRRIPVNIISGLEQIHIVKDCLSFHKVKSPVQKKDILMEISTYKNSGLPMGSFRPVSLELDDFEPIYNRYENLKNESGKNDFDDLLLLTRDLLNNSSDVLSSVRSKYQFIIVDEFQDTNAIQADLIYKIAGENGNISIVGDDDQSIYGFRAALPNVMKDFFRTYPNAVRVDMGINYRSEPEIIKAADMLIQFNKNRFKKDFRPFKSGKGEVIYRTFNERCEELDMVLSCIKKGMSDGINPNNYSILARTNQQLDEIAAVLDDNDVPYFSADSVPDIYRHFVFADIMSYLKLADGTGDKADLVRIINRPNRYIPERALYSIDKIDIKSILSVLPESDKDSINMLRHQGVSDLFRKLKLMKDMPLHKRVLFIKNEMGYARFIYNYAKELDLADEFFTSKLDYFVNESLSHADTRSWYNYACQHVLKHDSLIKKKSENAVFLGTMHRSKGLEWDNVFIVDCNKSIIPFKKAVSDAEIEEERRLFYVAVTRAKKNCYVLNFLSKSGGKSHQSMPSPFINELNGTNYNLLKRDSKKEDVKQNIKNEMYIFKEGDLRNFYSGQEVHHAEFGAGVVTGKNAFFVHVTFDDGTRKTFPMRK